MRTAFDQALENQALREAADDYAQEHGNPSSPEYRAAWLRFRRGVRTVDDLRRWQVSTRQRGENGAGTCCATSFDLGIFEDASAPGRALLRGIDPRQAGEGDIWQQRARARSVTTRGQPGAD